MKTNTKKLILYSILIISAFTAFACMILNHYLLDFYVLIISGLASIMFLLTEWLGPKILGLPVEIIDVWWEE